MATQSKNPRHTCLKLIINADTAESIFVKGTWFDSRFNLSITDGLNAWFCNATEDEVKERAEQWDQPVAEYIRLAEEYLGFQQSGSVYRFAEAGDGHKRLSWTFEKEGTKLEWRWKCLPSPNSKKMTAEILDFLMDANVHLSEEVVRKTRLSEQLKEEADKCLAQSERFSTEKAEFEAAIYAKFVGVLNSKKQKLRELRDQLSKKENLRKMPQTQEEEEESTDKTESCDEASPDEKSDEEPPAKLTKGSSSRGRGRGRKNTANK